MIHADQSWYQTRDINEAAALVSFSDVELAPDSAGFRYHDHDRNEEYTVFRFVSNKRVQNLAELWRLPDLIETYGQDQYRTSHPDHHIMAHLKAMVHNRNRYLDAVKGTSVWHMVKRGGRIHFIAKPEKSNGQ